jgi:hypothetical protein
MDKKVKDDIDRLLEELAEHKIGEIVSVKYIKEHNEWEVIEYLVGGYRLINTSTREKIKTETKYVNHVIVDLKKIPFHINHNVVATFVTHPDHDSYLYCKDCNREVKTKYKYEKASIFKYFK